MKQPTYIDLLNQFWTIFDKGTLGAYDCLLYFLLLKEANHQGWPDTLSYPNRNLVLYSGLSEDTIARSRNRLKQLGLIDYEPGNRRIPPRYSLFTADKAAGKAAGKAADKAADTNKDLKTKDYISPEGRSTPERNAECRIQKAELRPTQEQVEAYIEEYALQSGRQPEFTAERWLSYYQSNGWRVGRNPMKDWRAAVRTWFTQQNNYGNGNQPINKSANQQFGKSPNQQMANSHSPGSAEQARLERERDAAGIIARLAAQNRLD